MTARRFSPNRRSGKQFNKQLAKCACGQRWNGIGDLVKRGTSLARKWPLSYIYLE